MAGVTFQTGLAHYIGLMTERKLSLHWFRRDLRVSDNPALLSALRHGPAVAVFVLDEHPSIRALGGASRWWLHHSLAALQKDLTALGMTLILARGDAGAIIPKLCLELGIGHVTANRGYDAGAIAAEQALHTALAEHDIRLELHAANLLHDPNALRTGQGRPYQVYTPFWRALIATGEPAPPLPAPVAQPVSDLFHTAAKHSESLADWGLLPTAPDWAHAMRAEWQPGEAGAQRRLTEFFPRALYGYKEMRNHPDRVGTSRLSPHLAFGEISPRQIWQATKTYCAAHGLNPMAGDAQHFLKEVCWREFSYHLLVHFPNLPTEPLRPQFKRFPWADDPTGLLAWQRGRTGFPIVDAGMRELWQTGWMHNRVRMIAASFLIKDLLLPWQLGEAWFWDTLLDADPANNAASWQWVAGCGADAAPYFRIFNPVLQGEKFDPNGDYVRRFVPELARLPNRLIHQPWQATPLELREAGVTLGGNYPNPLVDHNQARQRALAALATISESAA